jgi:signal transduction histidine kinase
MNARLIFRMTATLVAVSLLLLAVGVGTAWFVHRWQNRLAENVRVNVSGVRAAEELEILVRETRTRLDHFLLSGDRKYLDQARELQDDTAHWLGEAERWAITPHEQTLINRARRGHDRFWSDLERIARKPAPDPMHMRVRALIDQVLVPEVLTPVHAYLDFNEEELEDAIKESQAFADRLVYALLFVATCGSVAGVLAGAGFARGLGRSLIRLNVLVRDTAGRLDEKNHPITFSTRYPGELEDVLRLISERVSGIVERLQQKERQALRAEQLAAVGQLAAGMAHELRNPLTAMKFLVQGALGAADQEEPRVSDRDLGILEEEITRLEQLIQSFLDFARPPTLEKRLLDVRPLVEQTLAFVSARAVVSSTRIELHAPDEPVLAAVDPGQFRQVVLNLVLNALEASPAGGAIRVTLAQGDGMAELQVADRGPGLPPELGERIFDPFTTTRETGLGLGLSICKRIAEAHGGSITGANRPEGGAVFTLRLAGGERSTTGGPPG